MAKQRFDDACALSHDVFAVIEYQEKLFTGDRGHERIHERLAGPLSNAQKPGDRRRNEFGRTEHRELHEPDTVGKSCRFHLVAGCFEREARLADAGVPKKRYQSPRRDECIHIREIRFAPMERRKEMRQVVRRRRCSARDTVRDATPSAPPPAEGGRFLELRALLGRQVQRLC